VTLAWDCHRSATSPAQCLGCGTRFPDRTFAAFDVDIPVALAIAGSVTPASPGRALGTIHSGTRR
jgi:hypothetical protein